MNKKIKIIILSLVLILGIYFIYQRFSIKKNSTEQLSYNKSCVTNITQYRIKGISMEPILKNGEYKKVLSNYYQCNLIKRGDIVALKFKTRRDKLVKQVLGIPNDKIEFVGNNLKINKKFLKNSQGKNYIFNSSSKKLLSIPLKDNKIPQGKYLILSNQIGSNTLDSRKFGYVEKGHIVGKVVD